MYTLEITLSHLYTNTSHVYCVINHCGYDNLQDNFMWASQNLLWRSNISSNDKKDIDDDDFSHIYTW